MQLFLFGGARSSNGHSDVEPLLNLIQQTIIQIGVKKILHIPFGRIVASEPEWEGDRFHRYIHVDGLEYLNAANPADITKAEGAIIFTSGGGDSMNLIQKINGNPELLKLINNASYIIGESAGAKIRGTYFRAKGKDENSEMVPGLNIVKNTLMEGHYIELQRQDLLLKDLKDSGVHYGIGIDSNVGISFDPEKFPEEYKQIGEGIVELKINQENI